MWFPFCFIGYFNGCERTPVCNAVGNNRSKSAGHKSVPYRTCNALPYSSADYNVPYYVQIYKEEEKSTGRTERNDITI